jgi:hypothetical protein
VTASDMTSRHTPVATAVTPASKRPTTIMSTVWCLVIDYNKQLIGRPFRVSLITNIDIDQLSEDVKKKKSLNLPADELTVWQCKEPRLFTDQNEDELADEMTHVDFSNKTKASKLASAKKVVDLGLDENEILLVQLPSAFSSLSFSSLLIV